MSRVLRLLKYLLLLIIVIAGLVLHKGNPEPVTFNYYLGRVQEPLSVFLVVALVIGALLGVLAGLPPVISLRRELRRLRRQGTVATPPRPDPAKPVKTDVS
ncbi:MAG: LapA family protein [Chromatiales bacterium]